MVSGGTGPQDELLPALKNREHAKGERRRQRTTVSYTDVEWARIVAAAALAGKRPGAWVAEVAHDAARWRLRGLPAGREVLVELAEQVRSMRNVLANIGGNLNDVAQARQLHARGGLDPRAGRRGAADGAARGCPGRRAVG